MMEKSLKSAKLLWRSKTAKSQKSTKLTMEIDDGNEPKINKIDHGGQQQQ
jgi:hypothetical protein